MSPQLRSLESGKDADFIFFHENSGYKPLAQASEFL